MEKRREQIEKSRRDLAFFVEHVLGYPLDFTQILSLRWLPNGIAPSRARAGWKPGFSGGPREGPGTFRKTGMSTTHRMEETDFIPQEGAVDLHAELRRLKSEKVLLSKTLINVFGVSEEEIVAILSGKRIFMEKPSGAQQDSGAGEGGDEAGAESGHASGSVSEEGTEKPDTNTEQTGQDQTDQRSETDQGSEAVRGGSRSSRSSR